jgi:saccharopine dehydrogenase (NAD+, L-lysine-forming)
MVYGATGYTGGLIAERCAEEGIDVVLGGRDEVRVRSLAGRLGLPHRAFRLDDPQAVRGGVDGLQLVLHCAGPFSATSAPMLDACLAAGAHYLDITGEVDVFEACYARDEEARRRGVVVLPGVGFDVVPTDCLARLLADRLPGARRLELAIAAIERPSKGTSKSAVEGLAHAGRVRREGRLVEVRPGSLARDVTFLDGRRRPVMAIPLGDLASAYRSTGIGDIITYAALPPALMRVMRLAGPAVGLMGMAAAQRWLKSYVDARVEPPTAEERERGVSLVWGRVEDDEGRGVEGTLRCREGYLFTVDAALAVVKRVLGGEVAPGATTPARALGGDFVRTLPEVEIRLPGA